MEVRITSRFLAKDTMPNFRLKKQTAMQLHPQGNLLRGIAVAVKYIRGLLNHRGLKLDGAIGDFAEPL